MFILIEYLLVLAAASIALTRPEFASKWFCATERALGRLARRRGMVILLAGLLAPAARLALLPILPVPEPAVHDEFSHLLVADTFAHGRVTNPTHPMWMHFESFHILQKPTYASMYAPAPGMMMAAGKVIFGHPFAGVVLSAGLMCAALSWMLYQWLPPRWALLGALLAVLRFGFFSYWSNSYWGGAVAATGGALVLGVLPRLKRWQRLSDALLMGLGLAVIANSRPYEGMVFSLAVAGALLVWMLGKRRPSWQGAIKSVVLPLTLVLGLTATAMGYYFWRITGSPFRMPYQVNRATYAMAPYFLWESAAPEPVYDHKVMRDFYFDGELRQYLEARSLGGFVVLEISKMTKFWLFYAGPALTLPLVMLGQVMHDRRTRFLLLAGGVTIGGLALEVFFTAHYAAPMTALTWALVVQGIRHLRWCQWRGKPVGLFLARSVPLLLAAVILLRVGAILLNLPGAEERLTPFRKGGGVNQSRVVSQLAPQLGRHLLLVRYKPEHDYNYEWVYNGADIDGSRFVWAREMGPAKDAELIRYFKDRQVWLVKPDETPPKVSPYPPNASR